MKTVNMHTNNKQKREFKRIHFIGIAGIGMSGLAQFYHLMGYEVTGSDRALINPENKELFSKLSLLGIRIFPQDGSFITAGKPDLLIYSTAIESDNPDFLVDSDLSKLHRSEALELLINKLESKITIAVTGSCGKTSVTAWLGESLTNLGMDPIILNGGMINSFKNDFLPGNFRPGAGEYFVFEADESDKSLINFKPDYCIILNIGTDHYSKEELVEVFETFLMNTKKGAVIESSVYSQLNPATYKHLEIVIADYTNSDKTTENCWSLQNYISNKKQCTAVLTKNQKVKFIPIDSSKKYQLTQAKFDIINSAEQKYPRYIKIDLPIPGVHNAENAMAVIALINLMSSSDNYTPIINAVEKFNGVHRRFEFAGKTSNQAKVFDDYAHNIEKIISIISTSQEISDGKVYAVFQPHGYGPFKFMKDDLFKALEKTLKELDQFILLPVFYAGGTSSFSPKAKDVLSDYNFKTSAENRYLYFDTRSSAEKYLSSIPGENDIILVMGARDGSLSQWAREIAGK